MNMKTEAEWLEGKEVLTEERAKQMLERHLEWIKAPSLEAKKKAVFRNLILGDDVFSVFEGANLVMAHFESCLIEGISFDRTILEEATFINCSLKDIYFRGADLGGVVIRECLVDGLDFSRANLHNATMKNLEIRNSEFYSARVSESEFSGSTFLDCSFINSDLSSVGFSECVFAGCNFWHADIHGATFKSAKLLNDTIIRGCQGKGDGISVRPLIDNPPEKNLSEFEDAILDGVVG